jgi:hypothetical protein
MVHLPVCLGVQVGVVLKVLLEDLVHLDKDLLGELEVLMVAQAAEVLAPLVLMPLVVLLAVTEAMEHQIQSLVQQ